MNSRGFACLHGRLATPSGGRFLPLRYRSSRLEASKQPRAKPHCGKHSPVPLGTAVALRPGAKCRRTFGSRRLRKKGSRKARDEPSLGQGLSIIVGGSACSMESTRSVDRPSDRPCAAANFLASPSSNCTCRNSGKATTASLFLIFIIRHAHQYACCTSEMAAASCSSIIVGGSACSMESITTFSMP